MTALFASDLHLEPGRPEITRQFLEFLAGPVPEAAALYLLGDIFEAWLGDDVPDPLGAEVANALSAVSARGTAVYVMQGNRDFLLGDGFCARAGATLLPDPVIVSHAGGRALVTHGDALCTADGAYQRLRSLVRDPRVQRAFLSLPAGARRALATEARAGSRAHLAEAGQYITDVEPSSVEAVLREAGVDVLLHGHTHRPGTHALAVDGRRCTRIVLGDWHAGGSYLRWDARGFELVTLPRG
ncbi:MAG: UDP-2,3-diacylglucosamine diphosphatase [Steroidobacteraceae bacterium]|nr:UDP-2,3-diacylglucosamine diphosphatase [Steroidobacteraceae bacterium]